MQHSQKIIVAIWDIKTWGASFGSLLMFQEELLMYMNLLEMSSVEMIFIIEDSSIPFSYLCVSAQMNPYIKGLHFVTARHQIPEQLQDKNYFYWPENFTDKNTTACGGSTRHIHKLWLQTKRLFPLRSSEKILSLARKWIRTHVPAGYFTGVVHLKNSPHDKQSNADQKSWIKLFSENEHLPIYFILIGNEKYIDEFETCRNCVSTFHNGGGLDLEMALMQEVSFFMGMSSGPCNLAVLSSKPYRIWKHPEHHADAMELELDENGQFPFCSENQKFIRKMDTVDSLNYELNDLFQKLTKKGTAKGKSYEV